MSDNNSASPDGTTENTESYSPLSRNIEMLDEDGLEDGMIFDIDEVEIPYRDTDHVTDVINGLQIGDDIIIQIGVDSVDVYHKARVVSKTPIGVEPFEWDNVICFDLPPDDKEETRRYVAGEIDSQVGLWFAVSFGYKSLAMNEIAEDDMWGHGWIITVARA